jgi:hypothetical protein
LEPKKTGYHPNQQTLVKPNKKKKVIPEPKINGSGVAKKLGETNTNTSNQNKCPNHYRY